ncbi:MAG TPA: hypothetical protein VMZ53_27970 [Kofleriaceae bacterium]|nr:hypothetical protein [Kofleriaceae bacterium]
MRTLVVLPLLLAACGEVDPVRHLDGGMIDSPEMIDAPVTPQPVTLTIMRAGLPQVGIVVHFQNADSTLVATAMTDATGTASQIMNAGGYVTAIDPFATASGQVQYPVRTFAGVKPGDHLRLVADDGTAFVMTATLPLETDPAINHYYVHSSCGDSYLGSAGSGNTPSGNAYFYDCGATTDFLVTAEDGNFNVLSSFFVAGQAVSSGGTLDFSTKTFTAPTARTYTFSNVPNGASVTVRDHLASTKGELIEVGGDVSGDPATGTLNVPAFANAVSIVEGQVYDSLTIHSSVDWGPVTSTFSVADYSARMLVGFESTPAFDATTHKITWTATSGVAPDFTYARGRVYRQAFGREIDWQLVAPYTAGTVTYPVVPAGTTDINFTASDSVSLEVGHVKLPPGGYDAVRANVFVADGPIGLVTTATGTAQLALSSNNLARTIKQPSRWFSHRASSADAELATPARPSMKQTLSGRRR